MPANPDDVARTLKTGGGRSSWLKWMVAVVVIAVLRRLEI